MLYFSKMNPTFPQRRKHQLFQYLVQYNTISSFVNVTLGTAEVGYL